MIYPAEPSERKDATVTTSPRQRNSIAIHHRGLTLVEILVAIALIIILLSILIVAVNQAKIAGQKANTTALMTSISQGLTQFKNDMGYLPPVLDNNRDLVDAPIGRSGGSFGSGSRPYRRAVQDWYSVTSIADYLLGYGDAPQDGVNGLGIHHPEADGVWSATIFGAADGSLGARNLGTGIDEGKVYGPYFELRDERLLASTDGTFDARGNLNVYLPGESNYNPNDPKIVVDYWGKPIRYYRASYPPGALGQSFPATRQFDLDGDGSSDGRPTLADVSVLRPYNMPAGSDVNGIADDDGDTGITAELRSAPFAVFSEGPDRATGEVRNTGTGQIDRSYRVDEDEFNRDNLVEVGQ